MSEVVQIIDNNLPPYVDLTFVYKERKAHLFQIRYIPGREEENPRLMIYIPKIGYSYNRYNLSELLSAQCHAIEILTTEKWWT